MYEASSPIKADTMQEYLARSGYCDYDHPSIREALDRILDGHEPTRKAAVKIFNYVRDEVHYTFGPWGVPASATLEQREGTCTNKNNLFVAMLRAIGIPAAYGVLRVDATEYFGSVTPPAFKPFGSTDSTHIYAGVYLDGRWIRCDVSTDAEMAGKTGHFCRQTRLVEWDGFHEAVDALNPDHIHEDLGLCASIDDLLEKPPRNATPQLVELLNDYLRFVRSRSPFPDAEALLSSYMSNLNEEALRKIQTDLKLDSMQMPAPARKPEPERRREPEPESDTDPTLDHVKTTRSAVLIAAGGLALFFAFIVTIHNLGWVRLNLGALYYIFPGLILANLLLAQQAHNWAHRRPAVYLYEGLHALVLSIVLHFFGGTRMGSLLIVYGFLVMHTEMLRPRASVFVTANICALCYGGLALVERMGWVPPEHVLNIPLSPSQEIAFIIFSFMALNFLALYANRYGRQLRRLTQHLQQKVEERTWEVTNANRELAAKAQALEDKQEELETLIYTVTHDLKNPLSGILLLAELLLDREGPGMSTKGRRELDRIMNLSVRTEEMLQDLLGLFKITSATETPGWVNLDRLLTKVVETLRPGMADRGVTVKVGSLPRVWGQAEKLTHVFVNLVGNAVKYVPAEHGEVEVSGRVNGGSVLFCVRDNGEGIHEDYHETIFELFGRAPAAEHGIGGTQANGTGVGLAIVKRVVKTHQGRVWVESASGEGCRFYLELPSGEGMDGTAIHD